GDGFTKGVVVEFGGIVPRTNALLQAGGHLVVSKRGAVGDEVKTGRVNRGEDVLKEAGNRMGVEIARNDADPERPNRVGRKCTNLPLSFGVLPRQFRAK